MSGVKLEIRVGFAHGEVSEEAGALVGETVNVAASLAGMAKPGQILTSQASLATLSPPLLKLTRELATPPADGKLAATAISEVVVHELHESATNHAPTRRSEDEPGGSKVRIQYKAQVLVLERNASAISLGRDQDCDVVIHDRRASRKHASIEWRNGHPFLIDRSTNGTFVALGNNPEVFLRRSEVALRGKGTICLAGSATAPETDSKRDCAHFEVFD